MKLRDRRKIVLSNIKQEDCKPTRAIASASPVRATSTNTFGLIIKQEDSKEHKLLSKQNGEFDTRDYYYRCDICKQRLPDLKSVLEHRRSIHGIKQYSKRLVKNIDLEPDVHDPNFHCKLCEKGYNNTGAYRNHLRQAHYMILKPIPNWRTPKDVIDPNPNDPNFYCRACDFTYKRKNNYRQHCRYTHGLNPAKFANRRSTSSSLTDSYCQACDVRLSSIHSHRRHLFVIHNVDARSIQPKRNDILPNVNDHNFYCRSCEKKSASKKAFKIHLKYVHSIFKSAPKKSELKPDADNPNNYCRACQKTYASKGSYRTQLRIVHGMTLTPLRGNFDRKNLPGPYNPNHYCSVCKKTYASLRLYREHCKGTHFMELNYASILNHTATIDVNSPNYYCAQCEHSFNSKASFKGHLRRAHQI